VRVRNLCGVAEVGAGENHTCARTTDGNVYCWGRNHWGQIGNSQRALTDAVGVQLPSKVVGIDADARQLAVGENGACAITSTLGVKCWGRNSSGEAGTSSATESVRAAAPIANFSGADAIASGQDTTCAAVIEPDVGRKLYCWGRELGTEDVTNSHVPAQLGDDTSVAQVVLGGGENGGFGCIRLNAPDGGAGEVKCWGDNGDSQLATPTAGLRSTTLRQVMIQDIPLKARALDADANGTHICAVTGEGAIYCWGSNGDGELGRGTETQSESTPAPVIGL
jgi:alpha-tubulin suppressor-like RCC1 family protein